MIAAVTMVKDEADIIEASVRHMAAQVDLVIVADNGSTDGTREILEGLPVSLLNDPDPAYYQAAKMTALAHRARKAGATWVVPFDADEVWLPREAETIAEQLDAAPAEASAFEALIFNHVDTPEGFGWRRTLPLPLRKVAARTAPDLEIGPGNHTASYRSAPQPLAVREQLEIRHYPYRSPEQFIRKVRNGCAAYAETDLPEEFGKHWRDYGRLLEEGGEAALQEHYRRWWYAEQPEADPELTYDPCPAPLK